MFYNVAVTGVVSNGQFFMSAGTFVLNRKLKIAIPVYF